MALVQAIAELLQANGLQAKIMHELEPLGAAQRRANTRMRPKGVKRKMGCSRYGYAWKYQGTFQDHALDASQKVGGGPEAPPNRPEGIGH